MSTYNVYFLGTFSKQGAFSKLKGYAKEFAKNHKIYIGVTNDPDSRKNWHEGKYNITITKDKFVVCKCNSKNDAVYVEKELHNLKDSEIPEILNDPEGGAGNVTEKTKYVYVYPQKKKSK